jgi:hypothetical protein
MEGPPTGLAAGAGTAATLAYTGLNTLAYVVAALTLVFAGVALLRLVPRRAPEPCVLGAASDEERS